MKDFLIENQIEIEDIYSGNHCWTECKRRIGLPTSQPGINENALSKRLGSLLYVDDRELLKAWKYAIQNKGIDSTRIQMLSYQMVTAGTISPSQFIDELSAHPAVKEELIELIDWQLNQSDKIFSPFQDLPANWPLSLHSRYSRSDILTAVGFRNANTRPDFREGCLVLEAIKTELMFVTLDKSKGFHESVQYHDYAISPNLFHWQTQNRATQSNKIGKRYIESTKGNEWHFFLFVRENTDSAFIALGEVVLKEFDGERPIQVTWLLKQSMTAELFRRLSIIRAV